MASNDKNSDEKNDQPLRPRFQINKRRISDESGEKDDEKSETSGHHAREDFAPEKIMYVEIDEEITTVFDRIKRLRQKKIALVIPRRAHLLQSIVNLKILKKKIDELEKEVVIITSDALGLQLAEKVGIPVTEKLFEKTAPVVVDEKRPLLRGERPTRIKEKKVSISEVIHTEKPRRFGAFVARIKEALQKRKQQTRETRFVFVAPNKQALFTLILVSVLLLLAVAYIALPGATIAITPRATVLDPSFNVTFLDYDKNRGFFDNPVSDSIVIPSYQVQPPLITKKITHHATGKLFEGENAHGDITITNLSTAPWDLAARTRFQTESGLIFRIQNAVRVPAAQGAIPGTLTVPVVADPFDANNQVIGSLGNIPPQKFSLPGLKNEENRKKLVAESHEPMLGGVSQTVKSVTKEDLDAARQATKKDIEKSAVDELKKYLETQNLEKKTNLSLLPDRNVLKISEPTITIAQDLVGTATDDFEVTASYTLSGIAFDRSELTNAIKERIVRRVDPDKKLLKINDEDISYRFLDQDPNVGRVRVTATMRALQVYELDPEKENGRRFIKKVTDHIQGMQVKDAEAYLQQQTDEVARVVITTWPIWAPTIPNIADNIKFTIKEDEIN